MSLDNGEIMNFIALLGNKINKDERAAEWLIRHFYPQYRAQA
jgi:hypothetical protein